MTMEISGRDNIKQTGNNANLKIDNRHSKEKTHWHQTWWGVLIITVTSGIVVVLILKFMGIY